MTDDLQSFRCPRCAGEVEERFYGPCRSCREQLVASMGERAREVQAEPFEPKMNVVANHVATKD